MLNNVHGHVMECVSLCGIPCLCALPDYITTMQSLQPLSTLLATAFSQSFPIPPSQPHHIALLLYFAFCGFRAGNTWTQTGSALCTHSMLSRSPIFSTPACPPFCQSLKQIVLHGWRPYAYTQKKVNIIYFYVEIY